MEKVEAEMMFPSIGVSRTRGHRIKKMRGVIQDKDINKLQVGIIIVLGKLKVGDKSNWIWEEL